MTTGTVYIIHIFMFVRSIKVEVSYNTPRCTSHAAQLILFTCNNTPILCGYGVQCWSKSRLDGEVMHWYEVDNLGEECGRPVPNRTEEPRRGRNGMVVVISWDIIWNRRFRRDSDVQRTNELCKFLFLLLSQIRSDINKVLARFEFSNINYMIEVLINEVLTNMYADDLKKRINF